jgi:hypothetical protein
MIASSTQARISRTPTRRQSKIGTLSRTVLAYDDYLADSSPSRPVVNCENLAAGDIATLRYVTACGLLFYQSLRSLQEVSYYWHLNVRLQLVVEITNARDAQSRV